MEDKFVYVIFYEDFLWAIFDDKELSIKRCKEYYEDEKRIRNLSEEFIWEKEIGICHYTKFRVDRYKLNAPIYEFDSDLYKESIFEIGGELIE